MHRRQENDAAIPSVSLITQVCKRGCKLSPPQQYVSFCAC